MPDIADIENGEAAANVRTKLNSALARTNRAPLFFPEITGLTGGTETDLDAIDLSELPTLPCLVAINISGEPRLWLVRDEVGDETEDSAAGIIEHDTDDTIIIESIL